MGRNWSILASGAAAYWPFWMVGLGGAVLLIVGLLALVWLPKIEERSRDDVDPYGPVEKIQKEPEPFRQENVCLARLGKQRQSVFCQVSTNSWTSFGTNGDCILPGAGQQDPKLGRVHFYLRLKDGGFMVRSGKRETFVNGVPIRALGEVPMRSGELIRAGSFEYRVLLEHSEDRKIREEETRL